MTGLLRFKQSITGFFSTYESVIIPPLKYLVAFLFFFWINQSMGYMDRLNHIYVILLLALVCCLLPPSMTVFVGMVMILIHSYGLGIETAAFMLVMVLLMAIFFLRFSAGTVLVLALTPISFTLGIPILLPMCCGLLLSAASALPAACGVILYYFIRFISTQSAVLSSEAEPVDKLKLPTDGLIMNWGMWITVVAFVLVILLVCLIRSLSFDYAWHVAIVFGIFVYIVVMIGGSKNLEATIDIPYLLISSGITLVICFVVEFFCFGGNYRHTERVQFEDDDYIYYVKAVPKYYIPAARRSVRKINAEPEQSETITKNEQAVTPYANPIFQQNEPVEQNLEKKLEESLRDL